jgi:peroxiredoxin
MNIGDRIKDFSLKDQNDQVFSTSEISDKRILLSFHPLAWTSICAKQMQALEQNFINLTGLNTLPIGVSIDHVPSKQEWSKFLNVKQLRMLCDFWPHGDVSKMFGLFRDADGFSERANIILDSDKKIIFFKVYPIKLLPDLDEVLDFLNKTYS